MAKKPKASQQSSGPDLDVDAARLIKTAAKDVAEIHRRVAQEAGKFDADAEEHFRDIRDGGRRFTRPFRP